jgi:hypothetical protein
MIDCVWQNAILALDTSVFDNDQVENLIKFFPTKEEIEMLKVTFPNALFFTL